jgi:hypothetical protein
MVVFYHETLICDIIQRIVGVYRLEVISILKLAAVSSSANKAIGCEIQTTAGQCGCL